MEEKVESKSERGIRIFLTVQYFIQTLFTTVNYMAYPGSGEGVTPLQMLIQSDGYHNYAQIMMAVYGGVLVVFPMVAFFFCLLDKKSKKKYVVSWLCCVTTVALICLSLRSNLGFGAVFTLLLCIVTMFMTTQGFQATRMRERSEK